MRKSVAEGLFNSALSYCLPLFGGLDLNSIQEIQILQNKAARIVCRAPPRASRIEMFRKLGWVTVNQLITYTSLMCLFRIRISREPEYLSDLLTRDSRNGRITILRQNLTLSSQSFCVRGPNSWNQLPSELRQEERISVFKTNVKKWISANIEPFLD